MTANQIAYHRMVEEQRANLAQENLRGMELKERIRSNLTQEGFTAQRLPYDIALLKTQAFERTTKATQNLSETARNVQKLANPVVWALGK